MNIELPPILSHQYEFLNDIEHKYLAIVGGYRSGKTFATALKIIMLAAKFAGPIGVKPNTGVALSPTYDICRKTLVPEIQRQLDYCKIRYNHSRSTNDFEIFFGANKMTLLHVMSSENYKRMVGNEYAFACFDEMDMMGYDTAWAAWRMAESRLSLVTPGKTKQITASSTPEGFNFLYEFFEQNKNEPDRRIIKARTRDNPFIDPEYVEGILRSYPKNLALAYLEGEFVNLLTGSVYVNFDRTLSHSDLTLAQIPAETPLHIGMDFNNNHMSLVVGVVQGGRPTIIDEIMEGVNTMSSIVDIRTRYGYNRPIIIYPDASGGFGKSNSTESDITQLRKAGFNIEAPKGNPRVQNRVNSVNGMFCDAKNDRKLLINTRTCKRLTDCLIRQTYDDKGAPLKEKAGGIDGPLDALGYFIHRLWPIERNIVHQSYINSNNSTGSIGRPDIDTRVKQFNQQLVRG